MTRVLARTLMEDFAESTGIRGAAPPRRYLWTDAFAVSNFLEQARFSGEGEYRDLAVRLIDQVHHVLGRHRVDDRRTGWISGLSEEEGERHPTIGGLRIGKTLPERAVSEPFESRLEWDRDGQYFHYLTRWMHALRVASRETMDARYLSWALELARTAHGAFTVDGSEDAPRRMVWKMSIDLSRPLVDSMGHHDALDGLITTLELDAASRRCGRNDADLSVEINDFGLMCRSGRWATTDALGIGGLLDAAARLGQLISAGLPDRRDLMTTLLDEALVSLDAFDGLNSLDGPAESRLAFRELGLAIGLHGVRKVALLPAADVRIARAFRHLSRFFPIADRIEAYWSDPTHRRTPPWRDHADINSVMLATSLGPETYIGI